jgi:hypothetical protein
MRLASLLLGAAALTFATAAAAAPVSMAPVSISPEFQTELDEDLGQREGDYLRRRVDEEVREALVRHGADVTEGALIVIEISIEDAQPNRPTYQQLIDQPSLDAFRSVSIGGAELRAVLRSNGAVLAEVTHRRYNHSLADLNGAATTWTEARRAIRQFAEKVADAYDAHAAR